MHSTINNLLTFLTSASIRGNKKNIEFFASSLLDMPYQFQFAFCKIFSMSSSYSVIIFQIVYCNTTTLTLLPKLKRIAVTWLHPELIWVLTSICDLKVPRFDERCYRILGARIASSVIWFPMKYLYK